MQKVTNSFMAWVGGVNQATGATDALSGGLDGLAGTLDSLTSSAVSGALSDVADNMSLVTTAAGGLVGIGLARYLGGIVTSASSATGALISAAKSEVALAVAQEKPRNLLLLLPAPPFIAPSKPFRVLKVQMFRLHNRRGLQPQKQGLPWHRGD